MIRLPGLGMLALVLFTVTSPVSAAVARYLSPEQLSRRATLIVEATVADRASAMDPATGRLGTYVTLAVHEVHRGPADLDWLVIRQLGGRWGNLVHEIDAVAPLATGESVWLYLEPAPDGALRPSGMFLGKLSIREDETRRRGVRSLDGIGTLHGPSPPLQESYSIADLVSLAVTQRPRALVGASSPADGWQPVPAEFARLEWDRSVDPVTPRLPATVWPSARDLSLDSDPPGNAPPTTTFVPLSATYPTRWIEADSGREIPVQVQSGGDPLGSPADALEQIRRALNAWTDVPESRIALKTTDEPFPFTAIHSTSPASTFSGTNIVLFDDPYDDIPDPQDCAGVLAVGGYWRTTAVESNVNGVAFHSARQLYVIFNNDFSCALGDPDNLAEIATHEIGHGLGFGHSTQRDSIMRPYAYQDRGPRLGDDDRDAAHCHYPHTITVDRPDGGELWTAGSQRSVRWSSSLDAGTDPGEVDVEYSDDGGESWHAIELGAVNDGFLPWRLPDNAVELTRVRVQRPRRLATSAPAPLACSGDQSDGTFRVAAPLPDPGSIPSGGGPGAGLSVGAAAEGRVLLTWPVSCSSAALDYAIYEGSLDILRAGVWDHTPRDCSAGDDRVVTVDPLPGNRFFLVSARAGLREGPLGRDSAGELRPAATLACADRWVGRPCD